MVALDLQVLDIVADRFAAAPQLLVRLRATEQTGAVVHAMALRCQLMIEPQRRTYDERERSTVADLFGGPERWRDTLRPFLWTHASTVTPGFSGSLELDLPVLCSYDLEVAAGKYFAALDGGEIPLRLLFSGTVFCRPVGDAAGGFSVERIPWDLEAEHRLPVAVWRELMDAFFPGSGWVRLDRERIAMLLRFKAAHGLTSWDEVVDALLAQQAERVP